LAGIGLLLVPVVWLNLSCGGSTSVKADWVDDTYVGRQLDEVLVVGVSVNPDIRARFENDVATRLGDRGVKAFPSHAVLPPHHELTEEVVDAEMRERGIDAVIVTKLVETKTETEVIPGGTEVRPEQFYNSMYNYYFTVYEEVHVPDTVKETEVIVLESKLFDAPSDKMVWSTLTEVRNPRRDGSAIPEIATAITESLARNGLID
jgi:hypothetical protein